jgi:hypothetical protein
LQEGRDVSTLVGYEVVVAVVGDAGSIVEGEEAFDEAGALSRVW